MTDRNWDAHDRAAAREARALAALRLYQLRTPRRASRGPITRTQVVFEEHLESQFTSCTFCGKTFQRPKRRSLSLRDCDVCYDCRYFRGFIRSCSPKVEHV